MTRDEWDYLIFSRANHDNLYSPATVAGVIGGIILPDDWTLPEGQSFTPKASDYTTNEYDAEAWAAMESRRSFSPCRGIKELYLYVGAQNGC